MYLAMAEGNTFRPESSRSVDFLERILKWASISYALGFMTVLCNTAPLGVPALQLVEPVQALVGLPLTAVFWAVARLYQYAVQRAKAAAADFTTLTEYREQVLECLR